jgi:hypothetical protein
LAAATDRGERPLDTLSGKALPLITSIRSRDRQPALANQTDRARRALRHRIYRRLHRRYLTVPSGGDPDAFPVAISAIVMVVFLRR